IANRIVVAGLDDTGARRRETMRKCVGDGDIDDLELAVVDRLPHELRIRVDDDSAEIEFATFQQSELLVQRLRRQFDVHLGELRHQLPRNMMRPAAGGTNAHAFASQIRNRSYPVGIASEDDEGLGRRKPADQLEWMRLGPWQAVLNQREVDIAP